MSYCKRDGKDKAIFVTKEDGSDPVNLHSLIEEEENVIELSDGSINWDCPCLGGMAKGSCGEEFKKAFSCFHYCRGDEDKYVDCIPQFRAMQECFEKYPDEYGMFNEENDDNDDDEEHANLIADNSKDN
jgi:intermembrane space import and assembly protein 40